MSKSEALRNAEAQDKKSDFSIWVGVALVCLFLLIEDVVSNIADIERSGLTHSAGEVLFWEASSVLILIAMFPLILHFTRRVPLEMIKWYKVLPVYVLASILFSVAHVSIMVGVRKLLSPIFFGYSYSFTGANGRTLFDEFLYEFWKDLGSFALFVTVIVTFRHIFVMRQELMAAKQEASKSQRLTLKCGGRQIFLNAGDVYWVKAAGNYVEIGTATKTHLARITLAALQEQLSASEAEVIRVHRSWLLNKAYIQEVMPVKDGDHQAVLADGQTVPISRRYRDDVSKVRSD